MVTPFLMFQIVLKGGQLLYRHWAFPAEADMLLDTPKQGTVNVGDVPLCTEWTWFSKCVVITNVVWESVLSLKLSARQE